MKYQWFEKYCTSKKGAYKKYKVEWEVDRYMICDKMFIMHGKNKEGKEIITLKLEPAYVLILGAFSKKAQKEILEMGDSNGNI